MDIKKYIDTHFDEALKSIIEIIRIKTVKAEKTGDAPYGAELKRGLSKVLEIAQSLGFRVKNLDNYIGYAEYGEGEEYIAVLGHIDVVPEGDEASWSVPPYEGCIVNNQLTARGAIDNKAPIISALYSLKAVVDTNPQFNKRVRIIFGTNEESGDEDIKYYLAREKEPKYAFTPDGRFPVIFSEKGIYTFSFRKRIDWKNSKLVEIKAGTRSNIVPEKCIAKVRNIPKENIETALNEIRKSSKAEYMVSCEGDITEIICTGISAHASSPHKGVNALLGMYRFLDLIIGKEDAAKGFISFISGYIGESSDGEKLGIKTVNEEVGNLTISAGITNIKDDELFIKFNIRYPASIDEKTLDSRLKIAGEKGEVVFFKENHNAPLYFEKNHSLVKELQDVYINVTGRDEEPAALGGGTYAKLMPNTVAFGPNFKEYNGKPHSFDECMDLDMLKQGMEIYARAILRLGALIK
ncbi:dipeptidase PepV [Fusobacterium varium]|jgi:succinyl-diaminopimelate desuccinylase|uniref:dipeptidase PepV n=1 Tax=Fusobacterium varium TaxID=856 RepID=UPI000E40CF4A|nr:dipeptidase PepV [Fusobacterium varium]RGJ29481.1 dipeptidase PepV [Fusobacterium varium]